MPIAASRRAPLGQEAPRRGKLLYNVGELARHVHIACAIYRHTFWEDELSVTESNTAPLNQEGPCGVEFLYTVVVSICHVDVPSAVHGHALLERELSPKSSRGAPRKEESARGLCGVHLHDDRYRLGATVGCHRWMSPLWLRRKSQLQGRSGPP